MPRYAEYNLNFDDVYDAVFRAYSKLYDSVQDVRDPETIERFNSLANYVSILEHLKSYPDRQRALVDAVNDYREQRDGVISYLSGARIFRPDPVLSILCDGYRSRWNDVCGAFGISPNGGDAQILSDVVDNMPTNTKQEVQPC